MKKLRIFLYAFFLIAVVSNLAVVKPVFELFFEGKVNKQFIDDMYISQDTTFAYHGPLKDTLTDPYYKVYKLKNQNVIFCRVQSKVFWKFWNWYDYLVNPKWQLNYVDINPREVNRLYSKALLTSDTR